MSELVRAVTHLAHLVGDTIVQGSATSHMVPVEQADGECELSLSFKLNCALTHPGQECSMILNKV